MPAVVFARLNSATGNRMLTSLGNIEATPLAALTIPCFSTGTLLYITGRAETLVSAAAQAIMPRQNVLTTFTPTGYTLVRDALPVRQRPGSSAERSPYSPPVKHLREELGAHAEYYGDAPQVRLARIELHSATLATFEWDVLGHPVAIAPGQAAVLDFQDLLGGPGYQHMAPGNPTSVNDDRVRTWTVSSSGARRGSERFALTMRLKPGGAITGALFHMARQAAEQMPHVLDDTRVLDLRATLVGVAGEFVLPERGAGRPPLALLWVAGGIGVTPFLSMLAALATGDDGEVEADVVLVLSTREPDVLVPLVRRAMGGGVRAGLKLRLDVFSGAPAALPDSAHVAFHRGRIPVSYWETVEGVRERTAYVCGPLGFERAVLEALKVAVDIDASLVRRENFEY